MPNRKGHCLCGEVTFEAEFDDTTFSACHCGTCRRITGGAPAFAKMVDRLEVTGGSKSITTYRSSDFAERAHCSTCGTYLWYHVIGDAVHAVSVGAFDDSSDFVLTEEIFVDCKPSGYTLADDTKKMTEAEVFAASAEPFE